MNLRLIQNLSIYIDTKRPHLIEMNVDERIVCDLRDFICGMKANVF